jgi:glyoxylase-like metal-dependent hydrolase (beta-lactamase superfamily II)
VRIARRLDILSAVFIGPGLRAGLFVTVAWLLLSGPSVNGTAAPEGVQSSGGQTSIAAEGGLEILQLRPNFFMIAGAGSNIGVQVGDDGVVVVDAGSSGSAANVLAAIQKISPRPIRYVIDTSADPDHVGGNETLSKAGQTLFTAAGSFGLPGNFLQGVASILSAEKVLARMSAPTGQASPYPAAAWPTETFDHARKYMFLNGEGIEILHQPAAHTDGDAIVFFRRSDVVVAGDILDMTRFPAIDIARGGSIEGEIAALNRLIDLAIPSVPIVSREAGTVVIPGHGRLCDQLDVVEYRDMVSIIRDRVRDLRDAGMALDQVKAAAPARGYTRRYGGESGSATDGFIEAIYNSLPRAKK